MTDQPTQNDNPPKLSNLSAGNRISIFSGFLFFVSLLFNWTETDFGMVMTTRGYEYLDFNVTRSDLPNLIPFSILATLGCILLCIPFLKPVDKDKKKSYLVYAIIQTLLSVIGLHGILILWFIQLPASNSGLLFGGWLGLIAISGLLYGSIKTRSEILWL